MADRSQVRCQTISCAGVLLAKNPYQIGQSWYNTPIGIEGPGSAPTLPAVAPKELASMQGEYTQIPLRRRDGSVCGHTVVDVDDAVWLQEWTWRLHIAGQKVYRCQRMDGRIHTIYMHREILGLPRRHEGIEGDHINGNTLDNRRANLRIVSHAQNVQNKPPYTGGRSRYRGVNWHAGHAKWEARGRLNGVRYHIGMFNSEDDAGRAAAEWRNANMPYSNPTRDLRGEE